jgi:NhaP-type Na+/H+ or K+/H+ antiporter
MVLASILAATDSVAALTIVKESDYPKINSILFGEGVVNDALSILIFDTVNRNMVGDKEDFHVDNLAQGQFLGTFFGNLAKISLASLFLGISFGLIGALVFKWAVDFKKSPS